MTDRILALVDGSDFSRSVCLHAAWIAQRLELPVDLLHVLGRREAADRGDRSGALSLGARTALLEELAALDAARARLAQAKGRAILEDAQAILAAESVEATPHLRQGDLIDTVAEIEPSIRALVVGKRGEAAGFASDHLGSNLERILRATTVPVFIATADYRPVRKVLVAYDGGASARVAIDRMAASPVFRGLAITLTCAGNADEASRKLERARGTLLAAGVEVETCIVPGEPEVALQAKIEAEGFDLLVMGAYGHSRIRSLIIGSTTTALIRACTIPMLVYR
ncbi:universal stress protein [Rhodobacter sphaeroides]|jgi:Universal stress protein UspA and related nucleotide-binding proteins|uniref:Universal stress protein UspA-like protein n=1 Tax=Cereibacter sphaeroides (strain ATCC 17023 / DSM 158 / JCM 6121 / CCUG 31486 / LMG 2827 / NBRC 12203 / NCIMB 8253 / ATH 2.4.1.) TaxID=272943 RepID=U5NRS8_CERS4|nr:universal stress protein [Cereibacter sphaeroides]AGY32505.1 universal stress protein UspA-like protein [Cereibacter sphaeroides 2.4.1]AMJ49793.1 universal stress protein UspA [Cereibacter sphaeroides]ANS36552.1 universal stress protein UspA [Cereibacter sphaeroides]ATN65564.1 universal stress protein UspA [Cereibacter sphaeroides]AXC64173.1 universal stress protein [Cereibacter sphaeroides 2.4.1]